MNEANFMQLIGPSHCFKCHGTFEKEITCEDWKDSDKEITPCTVFCGEEFARMNPKNNPFLYDQQRRIKQADAGDDDQRTG